MQSITHSLPLSSRSYDLMKGWLASFLGSCFLALCAQISIPLGFTPVPLTLQVLAVLLLGSYLGPKRGMWAVLFYLLEGALGAPVFAGQCAGLSILTGVTAGYLVGFVLAAGLVGALIRRYPSSSFVERCVWSSCGVGVIHLCGALWLSRFVGWQAAWTLGVIPFLIGDAIKVVVVAALMGLRRG